MQSVVLWGLCDAASAALLYCHERQDPRVAGLWLLNPWVRSAESLARTHVKHYYLQRLRQPEFWRKLLAGKVSGTAMADLWTSLRKLVSGQRAAVDKVADESRLPFPARMALGLLRVQRPVQIVLSGQDYTAREFEDHAARDSAWREALAQRQVQVLALQNADHTCSGPDDARWVLQHSCSFCDALA